MVRVAAPSSDTIGPATSGPATVAPAAVLLRRLRCSSWTFTPLATTRCHTGVPDSVRVRASSGRYLAWSATRHRWVVIPYAWDRQQGRLVLDARMLTVPQPAPAVPTTVWRWTCTTWRLVSATGPTICSAGAAAPVRAIFASPGAAARIFDRAAGHYTPSPYRWNPRGGFLALDATLVPVASVDLGASMTPRPSPTVTDFVVRCASGSVTATISARAGGGVTFDGQPHSSSATATVPLSEGQSVRWTLQLPGHAALAQQARCLPADLPTATAVRTGDPASQWYLVTPTLGAGVVGPKTYVVMADDNGTPVWWNGVTGYSPIDAKILPDGELAWSETGYTFSLVNAMHHSDWSGVEGATIGAALGLDHHDIVATSDGNYLGIRYVFRDCPATPSECVDLTFAGGSTAATIIDGELVKFSPAGAVLWTWRARDHISFAEWADLASPLHDALARLDLGGHDNWDINHINSVEEDGDGVIVSFRHLDAVYRIRTSDGSIDWKLGGTTTARSLTVLGQGGVALLASQHDARRLANGHVSLFDNGTELGLAPRDLEVAIDPTALTASVVSVISETRASTSACCGSARKLSGGGWVTAWGGTGLITETNPAGKAVLSIDYGNVFSYRAVPIAPGVVSRATLVAGMDTMHPRPS
jgi:hypothetical protein